MKPNSPAGGSTESTSTREHSVAVARVIEALLAQRVGRKLGLPLRTSIDEGRR